ncbi:MAG: rRNA pseudouridine synthase [Actinomycetota bacterium]|nr:rRNA pseudouridine synthase [Actinomycetota bacterium]
MNTPEDTYAAPQPGEPATGIRLQRVLAMAGLGSRRHCEELIAAGRVDVDGSRVDVQGMRVDPSVAVIRVDGERLATASHLVHLALHKPSGVLSAMADDRGRPTVGDLVADRTERLFHVGRLDADTEGLLLLMNDGELAHRLSHPSYEIAKTYLAEVAGPVARDVGRRLRRGVELEDATVAVDSFRLVGSAGARVMVELVLHEGRKHVVRRLLEAVGHPVSRLVRTSVGPVQLGTLKAGRLRHLTRHEVGALYRAVDL